MRDLNISDIDNSEVKCINLHEKLKIHYKQENSEEESVDILDLLEERRNSKRQVNEYKVFHKKTQKKFKEA